MNERKVPTREDRHGAAGALILACLIWLLAAGWAHAAFTLEDERKLGREFYENLEKHDALIKDPKVNQYITRLGQAVLSHSDKAPFDFKFSVIRSSAINAFATPGGYVYVNRGIITLSENEAELAGILAHEIAHVNARHIASIIEKSQKVGIASLAAILAAAFLGGGGDLGAATMAFATATAATLNLKYSREHEEEADRMGLTYLVGAGYDGRGMLDMLQLMRRYDFYSSSVPSYFLTHPATDERIRYLDGLMQTRYRRGGSEDITGQFKRVRTRLAFSNPDLNLNLRQFEEGLKKHPDDVDELYGLAVTQERLGQTAKALETFQKALQRAPQDSDILRDAGITYFKAGDTQKAIPLLRQALSLEEGDVQTILYLGRSYGAREDYKAALELYRRLEGQSVDDVDFYYNLAIAYGKTGQTGNYHYYFGVFLKKTKRNENALYHLKAALTYFEKGSPRAREIENDIKTLEGRPGSLPKGQPPSPGDKKPQ